MKSKPSGKDSTAADSSICLFSDELDALIDRYPELPVGSIVGTLHIKAHYLCHEVACRDLLEQERG